MAAKQACVYTRSGRTIELNGKPYFTVTREEPYTPGAPSPHHVDRLAEQITSWLNKRGCLRVRASTNSVKWAKTLEGVQLMGARKKSAKPKGWQVVLYERLANGKPGRHTFDILTFGKKRDAQAEARNRRGDRRYIPKVEPERSRL